MTAAVNPYDAVHYPGLAYDYTHPDRLATVASLHGLESAPPPRCRVLELGCGAGGNIVPMAFQYPDSEFVGLDLSETAIAKGLADIAAVGLANITLRCCDIMDVDEFYGRFDYIIAHGVYSWVPPHVREKLLSICSRNLEPNGVAYLSYNSFPGSHFRNMTRDMMLFHAGSIDDPAERVSQARGVLKFVADASDENSVHGKVLRAQLERVLKMQDEVLFHDDLEEGSTSFLLRQVVDDAGRHGLQYLSDATFVRADLRHHSPSVVEVLERICGDDLVALHQYQDFIEGHGFRRTLLCRREVALQRTSDGGCIKHCQLSFSAQPMADAIDPAAEGVVSFKAQTGATISTDHRLSKAAILHLSDCWPRPLGFEELLRGALRRLGAEARRHGVPEEQHAMAGLLFRAACGGHLGIHLSPPPLSPSVSERPEASRLARVQVLSSPIVVNQQHRAVHLEDEFVRRFLPLVDGTRTVDDLVTGLKQELRHGEQHGGGVEAVNRESVAENLQILARLALLVG